MDVDGKVFDESDGERILIERLPRSLNKEHGDGREEVSRSESLDESNEEAVTARQCQQTAYRTTRIRRRLA